MITIHAIRSSAVLTARRAHAAPPRHDELADLAPEVRDDGHERPDVQRDVERLVEVRVRLEIRPVEEPRDEDQVPGRRDGQELREALDGAEHERLPVRERAGTLADAEDAEEDGYAQSDAGRDDDADALHARGILCRGGGGSLRCRHAAFFR